MINTMNLIKLKEYENFILFKHKDTGIKECFLKCDLEDRKEKKVYYTKYERI